MRKYRELFQIDTVRNIMLLGILVRVPMAGQGLILTLHIINTLGRDFGAAGLVGGVFTVAAGLAQPWRGRLIDRRGVRRTLLPSLIVLPIAWGLAPFVGYWWLLALAVVAGIFQPPSFAIIRSVLISATPPKLRRTGLTADSVSVEVAFAASPILAVMAVQAWSAMWALLVFSIVAWVGTFVLFIVDPATVHVREESGVDDVAPKRWVTAPVVAVLALMGAAVFVLAGTDLAAIGALKVWSSDASLGWVFALWAVGSIVGGIIFGALSRPVSPAFLLGAMALATFPSAFATNDVTLAAALFLAGMFCSPAVASTVDALSHIVPASRRGEAMGWHGAFGTIGQGVGAPVIGLVIDVWGWQAGFSASAALGLLLAVGLGLSGRRLTPTST